MQVVVRHASGGEICAWCEVAELRLQLLRARERETALEVECGRLQAQLSALGAVPPPPLETRVSKQVGT
jgi:hypothetical protein